MTSLAQREPLAAPQTVSPWPRTIAVAAAAAGSVFIGRTAGALDGLPGMVLAGLLVIGAPIGRTLSRRLLVAAGLLPWLALLWWIRLPLGDVGRVTIILSIGTGLLCGYVAAAPSPRARLRQILPEFGPVDLAPPLAGLVACWPLWPWLNAPDTRHALGSLLRGWDNSAHFAMTDMIVRQGTVTTALPPAPDGSRWGFAEYPQHFHTAVAALMELAEGPTHRPSVQNLVPYTHALGLVLVLGVTATVAAVSSLPAGRERPWRTWTVGIVVVLVYGYGPGLRGVEVGHANFVLATETVVVCTALSLLLWTSPSWLTLVAVGGAVVAVANEWLPLGAMAAVAFLSGLHAMRRRLPRSRSSNGLLLLAIGATSAAALQGVPRLLTLDVGHVLVLAGEVQVENIYIQIAVPLTAAWLAIAAASRASPLGFAPDLPARSEGRRALVYSAGVPLVGLASFATIFAYQLWSVQHASYYAIKLLVGVAMVSWGVAALAVIHVHLPPPTRRTRQALAPSFAVMLIALTATSGAADAPRVRNQAVGAPRIEASSRILSAVSSAPAHSRGHSVYLGVAPGDLIFSNGDQWFMALTGSWTRGREKTDTSVPAGLVGTTEILSAVRTLLARDPEAIVMVNPDDAVWIRREIPLQDGLRVISWHRPPSDST